MADDKAYLKLCPWCSGELTTDVLATSLRCIQCNRSFKYEWLEEMHREVDAVESHGKAKYHAYKKAQWSLGLTPSPYWEWCDAGQPESEPGRKPR